VLLVGQGAAQGCCEGKWSLVAKSKGGSIEPSTAVGEDA
jgi:hypothetical protein